MFVNTLTADGKYPVEGCENLQLPIQIQLSAKQKALLNFLFHFRNLYQSLNILKKNMMVIPNVLPKLQTVNILVGTLSKKDSFGKRFDIQHVKAAQISAKPHEIVFIMFFIILREVDLEDVSPSVR